MNWDRMAGQWKQVAGGVKVAWGRITDDDLATIAIRRERLVGRIQERYGLAKEAAEAQVQAWEQRS